MRPSAGSPLLLLLSLAYFLSFSLSHSHHHHRHHHHSLLPRRCLTSAPPSCLPPSPPLPVPLPLPPPLLPPLPPPELSPAVAASGLWPAGMEPALLPLVGKNFVSTRCLTVCPESTNHDHSCKHKMCALQGPRQGMCQCKFISPPVVAPATIQQSNNVGVAFWHFESSWCSSCCGCLSPAC